MSEVTADQLAQRIYDCRLMENKKLQSILADAREAGEPDPIILLSPACASFDQFKDFEARGDAFRLIVEKLMGEHTELESA